MCSPVALKDQPALHISAVPEISGTIEGTEFPWSLCLNILLSFRDHLSMINTLTGRRQSVLPAVGAGSGFEFGRLQSKHTEEMLM